MNETEATLKMISRVFLRSFIVAIAMLILWLVAVLAIGDLWFPIHSQIFDLSVPELRSLHLNGIAFFRTLAICSLLCPFIGIEWVLRTKKKQ